MSKCSQTNSPYNMESMMPLSYINSVVSLVANAWNTVGSLVIDSIKCLS